MIAELLQLNHLCATIAVEKNIIKLGVPLMAENQFMLTLLPDLDNTSVGKQFLKVRSHYFDAHF